MQRLYAHSVEEKPISKWHRLEEHLKGTAELAKSFDAEFGCGEWGRLAGLNIQPQGDKLGLDITPFLM